MALSDEQGARFGYPQPTIADILIEIAELKRRLAAIQGGAAIGELVGKTVTGGTVRTAASGDRIEMTATGGPVVQSYSDAGEQSLLALGLNPALGFADGAGCLIYMGTQDLVGNGISLTPYAGAIGLFGAVMFKTRNGEDTADENVYWRPRYNSAKGRWESQVSTNGSTWSWVYSHGDA